MTASTASPTPPSTVDPVIPLSITPTQEFRILRSLRSRHVIAEVERRDWAGLAVTVAAAVLSIVAIVYFYRHHLLLGYHDAFSHLEISRRILTGRTTGIAQLGTIWLPVPHILQALLSWNSFLYQTGLAGAIVSGVAFVVSSTLIYRIVRVFSPDQAWPAVAAATVFMTSPNLLYQQSTAMDELPFYAFSLAAIYGLVRWANTKRPGFLLEAAIACMLAMLCRYEGWFLAGVLTATVLIMARKIGHSWSDARGLTGMFAVFGTLTASGGWLLYNLAITGSPVNFLFGPSSSADQMAKRTTDVEIGSWSKTLHAYGAALVADHGIIVLALAAAGLVAFLRLERFSARSLPILGLAAIVPFYVVTIERGQEPIGVPPVNEYLLNLRFALVAVLPAALFIGFLVARLPRRASVAAAVLITVGIALLSANTFRQHAVVTVQEASEDLVDQQVQAATGDFLQHHTDGPILLNLVGNERVAFPVLDRVIYEGTRENKVNVWPAALRDPTAVGANIVVMRASAEHGTDDLYTALHGAPVMAAYHVVFTNEDYTVYQLGR